MYICCSKKTSTDVVDRKDIEVLMNRGMNIIQMSDDLWLSYKEVKRVVNEILQYRKSRINIKNDESKFD